MRQSSGAGEFLLHTRLALVVSGSFVPGRSWAMAGFRVYGLGLWGLGL